MTATKTNERPGTKAVLRHFHMSASKARVVLNLIRGKDVQLASEILNNTEREAADVIAKVLASAVANAVHNDGQTASELYVAAAYADEGTTMKRWRPRARGRATRIRKRACHITVIVARMDDDKLAIRAKANQNAQVARSKRVAESRRRADQQGRGRRRDAEREAALEAEALEAANEETTDVVETDVIDTPVDVVETEAVETEAVETEALDIEVTEIDDIAQDSNVGDDDAETTEATSEEVAETEEESN
jgi:large subunit ribosomal protein L22